MKQMLYGIDLLVYGLCVALAVWLGPRGPLWYGGLALSAVGAGLWVLARWQLGGSFSLRPRAHQLVTHGLYARFRHPIYVFASLALLGAFLALQVWPVLVIWLVVVLIQLGRVRREERVLQTTFGQEYEAYRRRTWF